MNLVILANSFPISTYVADVLSRRFPVKRIIQLGSARSQRASGHALRQLTPSRLPAAANRTLRGVRDRRHWRAIARRLYPDTGPPALPDVTPMSWHDVNTEGTAQLLRSLETDLLLVSSAPILEPAIFEAPRLGSVNIHYGIAPQYRGLDTVFWPLYHGDEAHVGVTLHRINPRIDAGRVLAHGHPTVEPTDDAVSLWVKLAPIAATLACDLIEHAGRGGAMEGRPQEPGGRVYLGRDRKLHHDVLYTLRRQVLRRRPRPSDAETRLYFR